jgi:hypothetical protein
MQNLTAAKIIPPAIVSLLALLAVGIGGGWYVQQMWRHSTMMDEVDAGHKTPPIAPVKASEVR